MSKYCIWCVFVFLFIQNYSFLLVNANNEKCRGDTFVPGYGYDHNHRNCNICPDDSYNDKPSGKCKACHRETQGTRSFTDGRMGKSINSCVRQAPGTAPSNFIATGGTCNFLLDPERSSTVQEIKSKMTNFVYKFCDRLHMRYIGGRKTEVWTDITFRSQIQEINSSELPFGMFVKHAPEDDLEKYQPQFNMMLNGGTEYGTMSSGGSSGKRFYKAGYNQFHWFCGNWKKKYQNSYVELGYEPGPPGTIFFNVNRNSKAECNGVNNTVCICLSKQNVKCPKNYHSRGTYKTDHGLRSDHCKKCEFPMVSDIGAERCVDPDQFAINQEFKKRMDSTHKQMDVVAKSLEQSMNRAEQVDQMASGQIAKLRRMWATEDVRRLNEEMRKQRKVSDKTFERRACRKGRDKKVEILTAIPLHEEVDDKTCLVVNRDELISAICNFKSEFQSTLSQFEIDVTAKELWPNICCASTGDTCEPGMKFATEERVKRENMIPFALAQGGKVTKDALYGEILDVLKASSSDAGNDGGYLETGMLNILQKVSNRVKNTEHLKLHVINLFKQISLCGPRVFNSPVNDGVKMCQLFHPYSQLLSSFHSKFKHLFQRMEVKNDFVEMDKDSFIEMYESPLKSNLNSKLTQRKKKKPACSTIDDVRFEPKKLAEMKREFCSSQEPFDMIDERVMNVAMFYVSDDIGRSEKFGNALADIAAFVVEDACFPHAPMLSASAMTLQEIKVDTLEGHMEHVLLAKVDSTFNDGYLRSEMQTCRSKHYIPRMTIKFGIYADKHNCCKGTKSFLACNPQACGARAPIPLGHVWAKEKLFYEVTMTGSTMALALDGNPILLGTKYTNAINANTISPTNKADGENLVKAISAVVKNNRRRRLVSVDYLGLWNIFKKKVTRKEGSCNIDFSTVKAFKDGSFKFWCSKSPGLCACIQTISNDEKFQGGNVVLTLFKDQGHVGYEIINEDDGKYKYGNVNDGKKGRRRRRLLSTCSGSSCGNGGS